MTSIVGWLGAFCLSFRAMPQAVKCAKEKHARGLSTTFLLLWFMGEICLIIATLSELGFVSWLLFDYVLNLIFVSIIIYYKIKGYF